MLRLAIGEGASLADVWGEGIFGRKNSYCKGSEGGGRGLKVQQRRLCVWTRGSKRKIIEGELPKEFRNNRGMEWGMGARLCWVLL